MRVRISAMTACFWSWGAWFILSTNLAISASCAFIFCIIFWRSCITTPHSSLPGACIFPPRPQPQSIPFPCPSLQGPASPEVPWWHIPDSPHISWHPLRRICRCLSNSFDAIRSPLDNSSSCANSPLISLRCAAIFLAISACFAFISAGRFLAASSWWMSI